MKKLLALVLALVMVMSLSVVSTSAAFADEADIDHEEAVEVMNALGIIGGKENNVFDPNGNVKRSEMAKMVTIALLGDVDPDAFAGASADLTDIAGHWAEGYIKYCVSQGIVGGRGNGTFDPDANVTTAEAAKMLLVALGYNSAVRGYTGGSWTLNVMRDAQQNGLLDELTKSGTNLAMDRDDAAQMIYNTLTATRMIPVETYNADGTTSTQYIPAGTAGTAANAYDETLLEETFDALSQKTYLSDIDYDADKAEFEYTFDNGNGNAYFGDPVTKATEWFTNFQAANTDGSGNSLTSKTDYSELYGQKVTVVYKQEKNKDLTLLGIYGEGAVIAAGVIGQFDLNTAGDTFKLGDTVLKFDAGNVDLSNPGAGEGLNDTYVMSFDTAAGIRLNASLRNNVNANALPFPVKAMDNDGDGKVDVMIADRFAVGKVTYASAKNVVVDFINAYLPATTTISFSKNSNNDLWSPSGGFGQAGAHGGVAVGNIFATTDDFEIPSVAKDNFIKVDRGVDGAAQKVTVLTTTEAKVVGEKKANTAYTSGNDDGATDVGSKLLKDTLHQVQIGDVWVSDSTVVYGNSSDTMLNSTYNLIVVNGFFYDADEVISASKDVLVVEANGGVGAISGTVDAKVMFTDGTEEVIAVSKVGGTKVSTLNTASNALSNQLYTYEKKSDDKYELKIASNTNLAGNDLYVAGNIAGYQGASNGKAAKLAGYTIADNATVFVQTLTDSKDEWTMISGSTLKGYSRLTTAVYQVLIDADSNAKIAYVQTGANISANNTYAYITTSPYKVTYDGTSMNYAKAYTANGEIDVYTTDSISQRGVYELSENTNGSYNVETLPDHTGTYTGANYGYNGIVAISAYENSAITAVDSNGLIVADAYKITSDTVVLNVDRSKPAGVDSTTIKKTTRDAGDKMYTNAYIVVDNGDEVKLVVYDISDNWAGVSNYGAGGTGNVGTEVPSSVGTEAYLTTKYGGLLITGVEQSLAYAVEGDIITYTVKWTADASTNLANVYVYAYSVDSDVTPLVYTTTDATNQTYIVAGDTVTSSSGTTTGSTVFKFRVGAAAADGLSITKTLFKLSMSK